MCLKYCLLVNHASFNVDYGILYHILYISSYMNIWIFNIFKSVHIFHYCLLFLSYEHSPSQITLRFLLVLCFLFNFRSLFYLTFIVVNDGRKSSGSVPYLSVSTCLVTSQWTINDSYADLKIHLFKNSNF